jgi:hypothetical protein
MTHIATAIPLWLQIAIVAAFALALLLAVLTAE